MRRGGLKISRLFTLVLTTAALPATIVLTPADRRSDTRTVFTDRFGRATLHSEAGLYAMTVVAAGFVPQVRPLKLTSGCSGRAAFALDVVPWWK